MGAAETELAPIRVAVADDHPLYRDGVRTMVDSVPGVELVGEAADASTAIELVEQERPAVLLLDLNMPGGGGMAVLRAIREQELPTRVLILTMSEDESSLVAAIRAGARGYLLKTADRLELTNAIATCAAGGLVFGAPLSERLAALFDDPGASAAARAFPNLTPREREVLDHIARGESNEKIARSLGLSQKTVRNQVSTILNKLAVTDRAAAIVIARDAGLGGAARGAP